MEETILVGKKYNNIAIDTLKNLLLYYNQRINCNAVVT